MGHVKEELLGHCDLGFGMSPLAEDSDLEVKQYAHGSVDPGGSRVHVHGLCSRSRAGTLGLSSPLFGTSSPLYFQEDLGAGLLGSCNDPHLGFE